MRGGIHLSQKEIIKSYLLNIKHSTPPAGGIHLSQKEIIKSFLLNIKHSTPPAHSMLLLMLMTNCPLDFL